MWTLHEMNKMSQGKGRSRVKVKLKRMRGRQEKKKQPKNNGGVEQLQKEGEDKE